MNSSDDTLKDLLKSFPVDGDLDSFKQLWFEIKKRNLLSGLAIMQLLKSKTFCKKMIIVMLS